MKDHILVVSQYFYPEDFRINDICREWVKRGHEVTVVTGIPNYPQGRFFKGYGWFKKRYEVHEGIRIIRVPILPRGKGAVMLALNYLSFVVSGFFWKIFTRVEADKVFIFEVSPMTQALVGVWYAHRRKIPCYIYVTDLWPESVEIILNVHNKLFIGGIGKMVDYIYFRCEKIFTSSKSFIDKIASRGIETIKLIYWPQYAEDIYKKEHLTENEIPKDGIFNLTFAGNIGYAQGLDILVKAAIILKEKQEKVRFILIGNGRYESVLKETVLKEGINDFFLFIDKKPVEAIPQYMASSDAALIILAKSEIFAMTIPSKTQSCLACGVPIIVSADGEVQQIIKEANCGFVGNSGDADQFVENIIYMKNISAEKKEEFSDNALIYYESHFSKKMLMDRMEEYIGG